MISPEVFWDKQAERYAKSPVRDEEAYRQKLEITQGYFTPESEVFEFGCGTGTTAIAHAPHVKHIHATDISSKMVEIARSRAETADVHNVDFERSTVEELSQPDASFDVVMGHNILHLLEDPEAAITKVFRLLKPGGVFVTSTVCLGDRISHWRILLALGRLFGRIPYVNVLKRKTLEEYFLRAGFEIDYQWEPEKNQAAFIILRKP